LYEIDPIPSDTRFREDIIWFNHGEWDLANWWKKFMTKSNRGDRKFRGTGI